jgi:proteasome lid subunit RPN8/RPN11
MDNADIIDINNIKIEDLEHKSFPINNWEKFRIYFGDSIIEDSFSHALSNKSIEVGGLLLGNIYKDSVGPYLFVKQMLAAKEAVSGNAQITFTHDTWVKFHEEIDSQYPDLKIVGWYHSHPGFGIFLSEMDLFIHKNFFKYPWQIALVVDPISSDSGVFSWENNGVIQCQRYFTGNKEVTTFANQTFPEIFSKISLIEEKILNKSAAIDEKIDRFSRVVYLLLIVSFVINLGLYMVRYISKY